MHDLKDLFNYNYKTMYMHAWVYSVVGKHYCKLK